MPEGMMGGTVNVPKVGKVKKSHLYIAVGGTALFVGWRWYQARNATAEDISYTTSDVGEGVDASGVVGSGGVSGNTQYAGSTTDSTSSDSIDTVAEWSQKAVEVLSYAGMDPSTVSLALGDYIAGKPLTDSEAAIARAALAQVGPVPGGSPAIIPQVGAITLTAPKNLKAADIGSDYVSISFDPVSGAGYYRAYRSGASTNVGAGDGSPIKITGLEPNKRYSFQIAADTTTGKPGPKSSAITATTKGITLAKPGTPTVSSITTHSAVVMTRPVKGATRYGWYINGIAHGSSDGPTYTVSGLKSKTNYKVTVAADNATQKPGPQSGARTFKTK